MKTHLLRLGLLVVAIGAPVRAAGPGVDAAAAFDRLKTLVGEWEADAGKARLTYELTAGGTALPERETGEKMPAMLTVYHRDEERLLLTHYCMAGNQPRMEARAFDPASRELRFEFVDATNLPDPKAGHMRSVRLRLIDDTHLATDWQFYENGQPTLHEAQTYTRVR
jgi:hypothetical protein